MKYITQEGETLDRICWIHYFRQPMLERITPDGSNTPKADHHFMQMLSMGIPMNIPENLLDALVGQVMLSNPFLLAYGPVLPAGKEIILPSKLAD